MKFWTFRKLLTCTIPWILYVSGGQLKKFSGKKIIIQIPAKVNPAWIYFTGISTVFYSWKSLWDLKTYFPSCFILLICWCWSVWMKLCKKIVEQRTSIIHELGTKNNKLKIKFQMSDFCYQISYWLIFAFLCPDVSSFKNQSIFLFWETNSEFSRIFLSSRLFWLNTKQTFSLVKTGAMIKIHKRLSTIVCHDYEPLFRLGHWSSTIVFVRPMIVYH